MLLATTVNCALHVAGTVAVGKANSDGAPDARLGDKDAVEALPGTRDDEGGAVETLRG